MLVLIILAERNERKWMDNFVIEIEQHSAIRARQTRFLKISFIGIIYAIKIRDTLRFFDYLLKIDIPWLSSHSYKLPPILHADNSSWKKESIQLWLVTAYIRIIYLVKERSRFFPKHCCLIRIRSVIDDRLP